MSTATTMSSNHGENSWDSVRELIHKRIVTFIHLRRVVGSSQSLFLNTIEIPRDDLLAYYSNNRMRQRAHQYFVLGLSLGPILNINTADDFIRALSMLMNEYQEYIAEGEKHRKKPFFRKTKSIDEGNGVAAMSSFLLHNASNHSFASTAMLPNGSIVHSGNGGFLAQSGGGAPSLHHSSSMVTAGSTTMAASTTTAAPTYVPDDMAFVYLDAKSYPFDMDYIQTFDTLCEVLCLVYNRIADTIATLSQTQALQDTIHKIDAKFKKIICLITKEIDELARQAIGDEFSALGYYSVAKSSGPNASFSMAWDPSEG